MSNNRILVASLVAALCAGAGHAHHSFAAFFDPNKVVTIKGTVTSFEFKNPHGIITLNARAGNGPLKEWRAETNAPVVLMRRGWARDSVKPGEVISIEGWASRDGKPYLRLRLAARADGTPIGTPFGQGDK